eukprot:TRINITY_DN1958_c0_g1_i1.p1 TRINITY_DN1958_c0_g1~~TRINITY_DN1958_c0_g1_i1.p1  ORF type:complete len:520 (+),score=92.78 TRINITY_DN1958_c0_g1_i1:77-1561(+)
MRLQTVSLLLCAAAATSAQFSRGGSSRRGRSRPDSSGGGGARASGRRHSEASSSAATSGDRYLLMANVPAGFASGWRTMVVPWLSLCAATGRVCVLPRGQFGIPAFRSTIRDPKFVELSSFFDWDTLLGQMPCLRTITLKEWFAKTGGKIDMAVHIGLPTEWTGGRKVEDNPELPAMIPCNEQTYNKVKDRPAKLQGVPNRDYFQGPWGYNLEMNYLRKTEGFYVEKYRCVSVHSAMSAPRFSKLISSERSVILPYLPGMVRGPFYLGGGTMKGQIRIFPDIPKPFECKGKAWPGFYTWPPLAKGWGVAAASLASRMLAPRGQYRCAQIRGEKLVLNAEGAKLGNVVVKYISTSNKYLLECMKAIGRRARGNGTALLLVTDMQPNYGSPSAYRNSLFSRWQEHGLKIIKDALPMARGFCGSKEHLKRDPAWPQVVRDTLAAYPGNCAILETALCRGARYGAMRFGRGGMGDFAAGHGIWYQNCEDIVAGRWKSP